MKPKLKALHSGKKLQVFEKTVLGKKKLSRLLDEIFKTVCENFLKTYRSRNIYLLVILWLREIVFYRKIVNKKRTTKKQENFAHHFGGIYLTNHLVTFL